MVLHYIILYKACKIRHGVRVKGLKACLDMDLIKLVLSVTAPVETDNVLEEFADVFTGIGLFP